MNRDVDHEDPIVSGFGELHERVHQLEIGFQELRGDVAENTTLTQQVAKDTSDLVEFARAASWIGKVAKPLSYIATIGGAIAATWVTIKGGLK